MKNLFKIILAIALIAAVAYIFLLQYGYDINDIKALFDKSKTEVTVKRVEIRSKCSGVVNLLVTSTVDVTVKNYYNRAHNNVTVRVTAYDKKNKIIKQKDIVFEETLMPHDSITKPILLPAKARKTKCVFVKSSPIKKLKK